ncbi:uncharacterized protein LOC106081615 isoform X2 [Stomoxys calcitrans]|uniref:MADF domain-containing protein n=1 Tax=Stomoxys calcitrans TaxID=35570 RepID=A0A1I8Q5B2_STOCA|nr:uncharacterized protein LOC106081615 isoform X2 [Stomoxys calcitrans]
MSVLVKRKRGRPRLSETKIINNIDGNLIEEVKKFPILYDRDHPDYRNKALANRHWRLIANILNSSESVVKNRMIQLRNRFNVEKRRVDVLADGSIVSNWPLYDSLAFLIEFTKKRRHYLMQPKIQMNNTSSDEEDNERNDYATNDNVNNTQRPAHIPLRENIVEEPNTPPPPINRRISIESEEQYNKKFKAFGEFLASSLIEMSEMQALHLVKKFTSDLVEYSKLEEVNRVSNEHHSVNGEEYLLN